MKRVFSNGPAKEFVINPFTRLINSASRVFLAAPYLGSLPYDSVWGIANAVAVGAFKYVVLTGPRLRHGSCSITGTSFIATYDTDDYWDPAGRPQGVG
jgi:hypothetical protein